MRASEQRCQVLARGRCVHGQEDRRRSAIVCEVYRCHYAIVEDGAPNRNRPGCPLSEVTGPLAIGETDRQDKDMLAAGIIAIEAWRDCADPTCANPKRLLEGEGGSFRLARGCGHLPKAPFAQHRADLYGARRAAQPLIIAALKAMHGVHLIQFRPNPSTIRTLRPRAAAYVHQPLPNPHHVVSAVVTP